MPYAVFFISTSIKSSRSVAIWRTARSIRAALTNLVRIDNKWPLDWIDFPTEVSAIHTRQCVPWNVGYGIQVLVMYYFRCTEYGVQVILTRHSVYRNLLFQNRIQSPGRTTTGSQVPLSTKTTATDSSKKTLHLADIIWRSGVLNRSTS